MRRTIQQIQNSILTAIQNDPVLSGLNSTSQVAIYRLWTYIIATAMSTEESLNDQFKIDTENISKYLAPATPSWIQNQVFLFQYSNANPQVVQLDTVNFTPYYTIINNAYKIVTNCSVNNGYLNTVNIKVAKGPTTAPIPLTNSELSALNYYLQLIKPSGLVYNCISTNADRLKMGVTVKYLGVYSSTIRTNLLNTYTNYLQNLPFNGSIVLIDLVIALRQVPGVIDIVVNNVVARADAISYPYGTTMINSNQWITPEYTTYSGYMSDENTSGQDFLSLLILQAV